MSDYLPQSNFVAEDSFFRLKKLRSIRLRKLFPELPLQNTDISFAAAKPAIAERMVWSYARSDQAYGGISANVLTIERETEPLKAK